jgi:hypothetical protein
MHALSKSSEAPEELASPDKPNIFADAGAGSWV